MSCLNTRHKLITLCCCVTIIALISSIMVINAFLSWSEKSTNSLDQQDDTQKSSKVITTNSPVTIGDNNNGMHIQIEISEITTSASTSTEKRRNWLHLQTYSPHPNKIDSNIIDIDQEISGSGAEDNEDDDDKNLFISFSTKEKILTTESQTTEKSTRNELETIIDHTHVPPAGSDDESLVSKYHVGTSVTQPTQPDADKCERWLNCEDPFLKEYVKKFDLLPSCPCRYPLLGANGIYDVHNKQVYKWRDSGYSKSYLSAYHKGAEHCIRSDVSSGALTAQNCCYDSKGLLITRGSGAGTPDLISPDVSTALHQLVDKVPWILCRGDWTKYNVARPPNNANKCPKNPEKMEYIYQIWLARNL